MIFSLATFSIWFFIFLLFHSFGVTVFYHRLLSHSSFKCRKWLEYIGVLAGYLAFQGSPVPWMVVHKLHHKYVDTPKDPHSPRYGKWRAYLGWIAEEACTPKDIHTFGGKRQYQPFYKFLGVERWRARSAMDLTINFSFRIFLGYLFGIQIGLASLLAGLVTFLSPMGINLFCHIPKLGYQPYKMNNDSTNVPWWIFGHGEQFHNRHHYQPSSARQGLGWEYDPSYWLIKFFQFMGWAWDVHEFRP